MMVKFWYNLVKYEGLPIESVPAKYREAVRAMLEDE